jgi:putative tryptophan/tyrosine transport system substrate-binding protein
MSLSHPTVMKATSVIPIIFAEALKDRAQALYVVSSPLAGSNRARINTLVLGGRSPAIYGDRDFVEAGGLMSYGADFSKLYRRAADYVDRFCEGQTRLTYQSSNRSSSHW